MDEADRYLNPKNAGEGLTAALNASSYRRTARKRVCVPAPDGKGWQVVTFEFWCPMILAGIRELTDTVQDRSIVITLQRAMPGEIKARLINGTSPTFQDVQRKLYRWAQDLAELDLDPVVPKFLHNRAADLWRPLYAIAHLAGGAWPERVRAASEKIHFETGAEENRLVQLLAAIKEVFGGRDRMTTADLVGKLLERDDEPWPTVRRGQPLDAYYLRSTLKGVVDRKAPVIRVGDKTKRGYYRADFEPAWRRYLSAESSDASETDETPKPRPGNAHSAWAAGAADEEPASETMRNGDPEPAVTADGSSASQPDVSDGDASGAAETKRKKRRKAAGSRARVSDRTDVSDGEASRGTHLLAERRRRARAGGRPSPLLCPMRPPDRCRRGQRGDSGQAVPQPRLLPLGGPPARGPGQRRMTAGRPLQPRRHDPGRAVRACRRPARRDRAGGHDGAAPWKRVEATSAALPSDAHP